MAATLDVLAIGSHPDDVELGCGATLAKLARAGRRVGILHLTAGEAGTRGTVEERRREAERAAEALGVATLEFLALGDGALRSGPDEEDELIEVLRRLRPELVLGPTPADRHPDHGRAHRLVADACFYAGLARRGAGTPHRPAAVFAYMQHDPFAPSFVVDVTATWPAKMAALDAYESQIHREGGAARREPATLVASRGFRLAIEGRARHFGQLAGGEFGEPFWSRLPLAVGSPWELLPGGLR
ncbi:MAG: bacillithiol biosynthesis deacetylase BshB1 [Thermoanaerobaculia bacterium]